MLGDMSRREQRWDQVDAYLMDTFVPRDEAFAAALAESEKAGLPTIQVSPPQGRLLELLARVLRARSILEIGTLGGYSTLWLARAGSRPGAASSRSSWRRSTPRWRGGTSSARGARA